MGKFSISFTLGKVGALHGANANAGMPRPCEELH